jgi:hypothetical protein
MPRLVYVPGTGDIRMSDKALVSSSRARARPVWRCSSSFASAEKWRAAGRAIALHCWNTPPCKHSGYAVRANTHQKKGQMNMGRPHHDPKPNVVVAVVGLIPVAVGAACVVGVVDERAAAQHLSRPPDGALLLATSRTARRMIAKI